MIEKVSSAGSPVPGTNPTANKASHPSFYDALMEALDQVNLQQQEAERLTQKLAAGEVTDLHQVMIAAQKASLSLQLAVQVRNKAVEAYQEIMRMPI